MKAIAIPIKIGLVSGSLIVNGERSATHNGAVETKTTELITEVNSNDEIQVMKCNDRNTPEPIAMVRSLPGIPLNSDLCLSNAKGARKRVAKPNRYAAMTIEGAYT